METLLNEEKIRNIVKQGIIEVFNEKKEILYNVFYDVLEDISLCNAIKEGEKTRKVSRKKIFKILNAK